MSSLGKEQVSSLAFMLAQNEEDITHFISKNEESYSEFRRQCEIELSSIQLIQKICNKRIIQNNHKR